MAPEPLPKTSKPVSYTIEFNAPALISADAETMPGHDVVWDREGRPNMNDPKTYELLKMSRSQVLNRKGFIIPDTSFPEDWTENEDDEYVEGEGATGVDEEERKNYLVTGGRAAAEEIQRRNQSTQETSSGTTSTGPKPNAATINNLFPDGKKYGFRFMYNPVTLSFETGLIRGVNTSYIFSGQSTALPSGISSTGASIGMSFPISRVDDMGVVQSVLSRLRAGDQTIIGSTYGSVGAQQLPISIKDVAGVNSRVDLLDISSIAKQGTMYDLDYLFRTMLGRQWKTTYRGFTADVGLAFSVPLMLYLSKTMIYRVRVASVSYTHIMFTPDMIPTYTEVSLGFERIPDVIGWDTDKPDKSSEFQPTTGAAERRFGYR